MLARNRRTRGAYRNVCGVPTGEWGLQLRIVFESGGIVRVAVVHHLDAARSMAAQWLEAARESGRIANVD